MEIKQTEVIWMNGRFVPWGEARVHVLTHALHYASSVFEGIRAYATPRGPAVLALEPHLVRLERSCRILEMPLPYKREELANAVLEIVRRNGHGACYIRPLVYRGLAVLGVDPGRCPVEVMIATWEHGVHFGPAAVEAGIDVGVSSWRRMAPDTHPAGAKAVANYLNSQLVVLEAKRHGYADGIVLDVDGFVSESSGANLFVVLDGVLRTPSLDSSILRGITRGLVIQIATDLGLRVVEERMPRETLYMAEEVFLSGTAAEITPVRSIDGRQVGGGARGELTRRLHAAFLGIVQGVHEDRHGWLTLVPAR